MAAYSMDAEHFPTSARAAFVFWVKYLRPYGQHRMVEGFRKRVRFNFLQAHFIYLGISFSSGPRDDVLKLMLKGSIRPPSSYRPKLIVLVTFIQRTMIERQWGLPRTGIF